MNFCELMTAAHDKGGHEDLMKMLEWWYEASDPALRKHVWAKLEKLAYRLSPEEAEHVVRNMKPRGQYWTMHQVREYLHSKGITEDCVNYYLAMNMAYNDYYATAQMFDLQNDTEFYFSIAKDFIQDVDAKPLKVEKYFSEV